MDGRTDAHTNDPDAICPSSFFEIGDINIICTILQTIDVSNTAAQEASGVDPYQKLCSAVSDLDLQFAQIYCIYSKYWKTSTHCHTCPMI